MFLTGPQAQTRQQQLALIRIALIIRIRDHHLGDRPDLLDGIPGVGEPPQVGVAGDEMTTQRDKAGIVLDGEKEFGTASRSAAERIPAESVPPRIPAQL
jgi:hypothetical protein